jgi:hypothetical protein
MTWYGNVDKVAVFPAAALNKTYTRIWLKYTLGCPTSGCSQWDYTTRIQIMYKDPGDTVAKPLEICRVITPYAGGWSTSWNMPHYEDITDYAHLLRDSVTIRAVYEGWSSGFAVTLDFIMVEGTPARDVHSIQRICSGGWQYGVPSNPIKNHIPTVALPADTAIHFTSLRVLATGHGSDTIGCSEFCSRDYTIKVNGITRYTQSVWKTCGENPLYPQAGTWVYDRANWCPGERVRPHWFDITPFRTTGIDSVDLNFVPYTTMGGSTPYFGVDAHLIHYKAPNYTHDADLYWILSPSPEKVDGRMNPLCSNPKIIIRNTGIDTLRTLTIAYGFAGSTSLTHTWTGNLKFMDTAHVTLPASFSNFNGITSGSVFTVTISDPNGFPDENPYNNTLSSTYTAPPTVVNTFYVQFKSNTYYFENRWRLYDQNGVELFARIPTQANAFYNDTFNLNIGCYKLVIEDDGGDGLSFWANPNQGSGSLNLKKMSGAPIYSANTDFGSRLYYTFQVTTPLGTETETDFNPEFRCTVWPNPTNTATGITLELQNPPTRLEIKIYSLQGSLVWQKTLQDPVSSVHLSPDLPTGTWLLEVYNPKTGSRETRKMVFLPNN